MIEILSRASLVSGNYFIAGAVIAHGVAKRQVEIKRQRSIALITPLCGCEVILSTKFFVEFECCGVGRVPGPRNIKFLNYFVIPEYFFGLWHGVGFTIGQ